MISAAVITLSDKGSRGERTDTSGPAIIAMLATIGAKTQYSEIIPDELELIKRRLVYYSRLADLVITTGGTGLSPRDVAPEATLAVIDRLVPGIPEAMRAAGMAKTNRSMLSRGVAGTIGTCLVINLPGSRKAATESLDAVLDVLTHAIEKLKGSDADCGQHAALGLNPNRRQPKAAPKPAAHESDAHSGQTAASDINPNRRQPKTSPKPAAHESDAASGQTAASDLNPNRRQPKTAPKATAPGSGTKRKNAKSAAKGSGTARLEKKTRKSPASARKVALTRNPAHSGQTAAPGLNPNRKQSETTPKNVFYDSDADCGRCVESQSGAECEPDFNSGWDAHCGWDSPVGANVASGQAGRRTDRPSAALQSARTGSRTKRKT